MNDHATAIHLVAIYPGPSKPWDIIHVDGDVPDAVWNVLKQPDKTPPPAMLSTLVDDHRVSITWLPAVGPPNEQAERFVHHILGLHITLTGAVVFEGLSEDMVITGLSKFAVTQA